MVPPAPPPIGSRLRDARVERDLSIEETAWRTRLRPDVLLALERDDFDAVGHRASVRTHLASYARFLGVEPAAVVDAFERGREPEPSSIERLDHQARAARKPPRAKWLIAAAVSAAALIAASAAGILGGQAEPTGAAATPETPRLPRSASRSGARVPLAEARVRVSIEAVAGTEVSVSVDGTQVFEGALAPGAVRRFGARREIEVVVADAGALRIVYNGRRLERVGEPGSVARLRFTARGLAR